jgi:hypothetical protein
LKVEIISACGVLRYLEVDEKMKVDGVKKLAMIKLHIDPDLADRYWLRPKEGAILNDDKTLVEQGVKDGDTLYLETSPPVVG